MDWTGRVKANTVYNHYADGVSNSVNGHGNGNGAWSLRVFLGIFSVHRCAALKHGSHFERA